MNQKPIKYISLCLGFLFLVSCAIPQVSELKKPKDFPVISPNLTDTNTLPIDIELRTYFKDPSLLSLFDDVLQANPDLQIAQQRLAIANSFLQRSKISLLPSLELGAIASGEHYGKYTMDGVGNYDTNLSSNISEKQKINRDFTPNYWLGARSSWEIDAWGKLKNQKLSTLKRYLASEEGLKLIQVELFTNIAVLYYQVVSLDTKLKIYQENFDLQQRAYEIVSAQREVGKATELAVQQFRAQNNNWLAEIEHIKAEIVVVEQAIMSLTGRYGGKIVRGSQLLVTNMDLLKQTLDINSMIHKRPDVMEHYLNLEASHADAKAARAAFYPRLEVGATIGLNAFSVETLFLPSSLAGQLLGGLMVPIFNKGQLKHDFNVATSEQEIAFLAYQKNVTTAYNELQSIVKQSEIFYKVLKLKADEVKHLDNAIEVSNDLYLTGYANYLELINSQRSKLNAELDLLEFHFQNTQNNVALFKALGGSIQN